MTFDQWWAQVEPGLRHARDRVAARVASINVDEDYIAQARAKAERGWLEHGGGIRRMDARRIDLELEAELVDALVYAAAMMLVEGDRPIYEVPDLIPARGGH